MKSKRLLDIIGELDERHIAEATPAASQVHGKPVWMKWVAAAACMVLLLSAGLGTLAVVAEAEEYNAAVQFFNDHDMPTEGLTRGEIKAVYRDITTRSFTYSKTAEVIMSSISAGNVGGYEILQDDPTPEDISKLWDHKNYTGGFITDSTQAGVHYKYRVEYKQDEQLGTESLDKSYIEKYVDDELIWSASTSDFNIEGYSAVSDGVIVYGKAYTLSSTLRSTAWMAKIDSGGQLAWQKKLDNSFGSEYIAAVLENTDGSYAVFSRGDLKYLCLRQYTSSGEMIYFHKTETGYNGIWNAALLGDGYLVQLGRAENTQLVKVDREGNITDSFSYSDENCYYFMTDMLEFNGSIYLSAYAVPRFSNGHENSGSGSAIKNILKYLLDNDMWNISGEELTPLVRDNYTAVLLVCEPETGIPQEFYSVKGSLGGKLAPSDAGELLWDVESITSTFYSPMTSSFTIGGTSYVFRYTFGASGALVGWEKTDEVVNFRQ